MNRKLQTMLLGSLLGLCLLTPRGFAQGEYEFGALGLISDYTSLTVSNPSQTGSVGPGFGFSGGFLLGQTMNNRWGGEFRYVYFRNDLELNTGSAKAKLGGQSHAIHYDVLYYFSEPDSRVRPYVAGGFGMKYYQGTGSEDPFQPGSNLALLTKTGEAVPAGDFGVGVKWRIGRRAMFRLEFRDYITPVPSKVIAASPGAEISGSILHQWAPFFGVTWTF
jgi:hypothetical protein